MEGETYPEQYPEVHMDDKNYSWKGSPNAGAVLLVIALVGAIAVLVVGFF
jgi:hypothetical protein